MVMMYSHVKVQGQWSVSSEDRVETNALFGKHASTSSLKFFTGQMTFLPPTNNSIKALKASVLQSWHKKYNKSYKSSTRSQVADEDPLAADNTLCLLQCFDAADQATGSTSDSHRTLTLLDLWNKRKKKAEGNQQNQVYLEIGC